MRHTLLFLSLGLALSAEAQAQPRGGTSEDKIDADAFNRVLRDGIRGAKP